MIVPAPNVTTYWEFRSAQRSGRGRGCGQPCTVDSGVSDPQATVCKAPRVPQCPWRYRLAAPAVQVRLGRKTASDAAILVGTAASLRGGARSSYGPRGKPVADGGQRQREVRLRQTRDDLPLERLVVSDGASPVGGMQQQRKRELSSARPAVAPSASVRRVAGHRERLAGVELPAGDVNLAGLPLTVNGVGHGRGLLTEHVHHPCGLPNHRWVLYRGGIRSSLSAY